MSHKKSSKWKRFLLFFGSLIITSIGKAFYDTNVIKVNKISFYSGKIPVGTKFSLLQVSDLHNRMFGHHNKKIINIIKDVKADIIVLTGDLINRGTVDFTNVFSLVEAIKKINPNVFFVTGNHEMTNNYLCEFLVGLKDRGVTILGNENRQLKIGGTAVNLVGIHNESTNHDNLNQAFANVENGDYTILLSHCPSAVNKYSEIPADLILCGHTHGGQVRLPFIGAVVGPGGSFFPAWDKGIYEITSGQYLYIDSGVGTSGYPVRFLNQSQVSFIEVKHGSKYQAFLHK